MGNVFEIGKVYVGKHYYYGKVLDEHIYLCTNRTTTKSAYGLNKNHVAFRPVSKNPVEHKDSAKSFRIDIEPYHDYREACDVKFGKYGTTYYITADAVYDGAWFMGKVSKAKPVKKVSEVAQTYGVQVSIIGKYNIVTQKYNFISKIEATKWAMKNTRLNQYATLIKMPNKYWENAGRHTRGHSQSVLAYERGQEVGTFRWYNGKPYVVDDMDEYMSPVLESGRLGKKIPSVWSDADKYRKPKKDTPIMKRELEL